MTDQPALIIYDGECIFCHNYVRLLHLRETVGPVELLDARSGDPRLLHYWKEGYDLNEGMLFVYRGIVHHGSEAIYVLAGLSTSSSLANRLNRAIFSSRLLSAVLYPALKLGRRITLCLRGRAVLQGP
ncbi:MAG TPA: DCC1-like thiol-disulfide oxidoreductase family protein [Stellaceae bacterium]|jgi:predicted DCC family thiol-disulfide oxidoreductase YuxK|nr:DCC1-like thiol-disulfide oxidoreductase family protein [Stellaceae bacterium]